MNPFGVLSTADFYKGLIVAVFGSALASLYVFLSAGKLPTHDELMVILKISGAFGIESYIYFDY